MRVQFNAVTWYSRLLSYLFIFGIFPSIVFFIGKRYQETVMVLSFADASAFKLHESGTYEMEVYAGIGSSRMQREIVGDWKKEQDPDVKLKIKSINTFYDIYKGKVVASGSWLFRDSVPAPIETSGESPAVTQPISTAQPKAINPVFQKNTLDNKNKESIKYYYVLSLDSNRLVLRHTETNEVMVFVRDMPVDKTINSDPTDLNTSLEPVEDIKTGLLR